MDEMTQRDVAAMFCLQGMLAKAYNFEQGHQSQFAEATEMAEDAVMYADALIRELNKTTPTR